jgi:PAS domain S-box-containing protein
MSLTIASLAPIADALSCTDPELSLARAVILLGEHGIAANAPGPAEPWLTVTVGDRSLRLTTDGEPPEEACRDFLTSLLRGGLTRAVEQGDRRKMQERMEMLSAASFEGLFIHVDGIVIDANRRVAEILGYDPSELIGLNILETCVAPEDKADVRRRLADRFEGDYVVTGLRKGGSRFRAELHSKQGGIGDRPVRVVALRDVTERERTSALIRESEARLRELASEAFEVLVLSCDGVIVGVSGTIQEMLGHQPEEMMGQPVLSYVAPSSRDLVRTAFAEKRFGKYEGEAMHRDGESIPVEIVAVASTLDGKPVRVAGLRDLREKRRIAAEKRKLEQQVERAQRLDSLGVLAGGIAHDFNNLLVGILGGADILLRRLTDPVDREAASTVLAAGKRAASLTRQMLAYAGQRDLGRKEPVDLGELWGEIQTLLGAVLSKKAQVTMDIEPNSIVRGDRATLVQIMMNLLTNASDALEDGSGRIDVRTRHVQVPDSRWQSALGAKIGPGKWLLLEVKDTGVGMSEATLGRAFEPFFSTKEKGHGLGLAACLGIVASHGGAILVESEPGRGSSFSVMLPASSGGLSEPPGPRVVRPGRPCRVLVIDDEPLVRKHVRHALELCGYEVEEAASGRSGVAAAETTSADVLILDMVMPDIDGVEVARRIRAGGSRIPIVACSGYLDAGVETRLSPESFQGFLRKPYGIDELIDAIDRATAAADQR